MKKLLLPIATLAFAAGCSDLRDQQVATEPPATLPSFSTTNAAGEPLSTICIALNEELASIQGALEQDKGNAELQASAEALQGSISDSCS